MLPFSFHKKDWMKRLAATPRVAYCSEHSAALTAMKGEPAMDFIGFDLGKVSSQVCILTEDGELIERRDRRLTWNSLDRWSVTD